jgi:hypothetical protein
VDSTSPALALVCLLGIVVGIVGVAVPVLPGLVLCWLSVLAWALFAGPDVGWGRWLVLAVATVWVVIGTVVKYAWPGRRLKDAGIPTRTLVIGVLAGVVGMFVIPVVGLLVGFVLGVWASEWHRFGSPGAAWPSTRQALLGAGLSMLIELTAAMLLLGSYLLGLLLT